MTNVQASAGFIMVPDTGISFGKRLRWMIMDFYGHSVNEIHPVMYC